MSVLPIAEIPGGVFQIWKTGGGKHFVCIPGLTDYDLSMKMWKDVDLRITGMEYQGCFKDNYCIIQAVPHGSFYCTGCSKKKVMDGENKAYFLRLVNLSGGAYWGTYCHDCEYSEDLVDYCPRFKEFKEIVDRLSVGDKFEEWLPKLTKIHYERWDTLPGDGFLTYVSLSKFSGRNAREEMKKDGNIFSPMIEEFYSRTLENLMKKCVLGNDELDGGLLDVCKNIADKMRV